MRITELLDKRSIRIDGAPKSKNEALDQMVELMAKSGKINDLEAYRQEVYRREEEGTTGVGEGIAIPHGKGAFVDKPGLAAMVVKDGVDYDSLDGEPVHLIFLIAAPNTKDNVHLDVLSKLSVLLMDEDFRNNLLHAKDVDEFLAYVDAAEKEKFPEEAEEKAGVQTMKINEVEPNRDQPRKNFDEDALLELSDSIKQFGVLQPLLVRKRKDYYEIIAGERRWRAAKLAGVKEVPVIVKEYTDQEILEIGLIENIQRENLNPIEEAIAFKRLLEEFNLKQDEVAERVSKSRTAVTNSMRLLKLSDKVQQMIIDDMISTGHARALLAIDDPELQYTLANKIFDEKLSVRETEKLVKEIKNPKKPKEKKVVENAFIYQDLEEKMKGVFGTKVSIASKGKGKGKIEIEYYSDDELEHLFDMMMSIKRGE